MTRRKTFDPATVPLPFWRREDVRLALARREIGRLFGIYLAAFDECTQTQLALLTEHDRSDISNFVRGTRSSRVTDIDVLGRIADGMAMPDEARILLGLAPADMPISRIINYTAGHEATPLGKSSRWNRATSTGGSVRVAICGSRSQGCDDTAIDEAVRALSRMLINQRCEVDHGPVGIGIEIMTYIADHYRPSGLREVVGLVGRHNVVRRADLVVVVGGGHGTLDEVDLAISMGKRIAPFAASGGAARRALELMAKDESLREWMPEATFMALGSCVSADAYANIVEHVLSNAGSAP